MLSVGIITSPRNPMYLGDSLESYVRECPIKPHVFAEPFTPSFLNESRVFRHDNSTQLGCVKNWLNAAKGLIAETDSDFIMICEDDILWREGAYTSLKNLLKCLTGEIPVAWPLPSDVGMISLYRAEPYAVKEQGWQPIKMRACGWLGTLCTVWYRPMLEALLREEQFFMEVSQGIHLDHAVGATVMKLNKMIIAHSPTLIEHIGDISTNPRNNVPVNKLSRFREAAL